MGGGGLSQGMHKRLDDEIMSELLWTNLEKVLDKVRQVELRHLSEIAHSQLRE